MTAISFDEAGRMAAVQRFGLLDTPREPSFDRLARMAARIFESPLAAITVIDADRVWFKASAGLDLTEVPRSGSMCGQVVALGRPLQWTEPRTEVRDGAAPPPGVHFYAGAPLITEDGFCIGTLCLMDQRPHPPLSDDARATLIDLAATVMAEMERRLHRILQEAASQRLSLINDTLALVGGADSFSVAVEGTLGLLCTRLGGLFAMIWTRSEDEKYIRMAGMSLGPEMPDGFRAHAEALFPYPAEQSLIAELLFGEGRMVFPRVSEDVIQKYPLTAIGYRAGMRSWTAQSLAVGNIRYVILMCFKDERANLEQVADLMAEVIQAIRPVLQRKQAQDWLELLQAAVDATADAVAISDAGGTLSEEAKLRYTNPAFASMTGYSAESMRGQGVGLLRGPDTDPEVMRKLEQSVASARPVRAEILNYRRDGTPFWADVSTTPIFDEQGRVTHWVGVTRDITEQRANQDALQRLTEELRERTRQLTDVARMARIGSWRWRVSDNASYWSDETCELFGVPPGSPAATGEAFFELLHPDDRKMARAVTRHCARTGADLFAEARVLIPGGGQRTILWSAKAVRDADRRILEFHGYCQDVTERRAAEAALRHGEKLRTLGQMTGGIVHDFGNLLTVILGNLDIALSQTAIYAEPAPELVAANRAALAAADMTRRLLSFARAEPLRVEPTDLNEWLATFCDTARRILGGRHRVTLRGDPDLPPCAVDRSQLEAAVLNLILNARDAMPGGGSIDLSTERMEVSHGENAALSDLKPGPYAVIVARDTGVGMPPDVADRVFEPFFTTKPAGSGGGLGLSMVFSFIRRSSGTVLLETAPGKGTTVRLLLPI